MQVFTEINMAVDTTPALAVPPDVAAFAAERGVADYLPAVQALARRLFPNGPFEVRVDDDPEISDLRTIVFGVDMNTLEEDQLFAAQRQWSAEIFQHCPSTHVHLFSLAVV
jgi:hypothetical protein